MDDSIEASGRNGPGEEVTRLPVQLGESPGVTPLKEDRKIMLTPEALEFMTNDITTDQLEVDASASPESPENLKSSLSEVGGLFSLYTSNQQM